MVKDMPVTYIPGVGQAKQQRLAELGLFTVYDVLHHFPFRYEDRSILPFEAFTDGAKVSCRAVVEGDAQVRYQGQKSVCMVKLKVDGIHRLTGFWFNQPYLRSKLQDGRFLWIYGKFVAARRTITVLQTEFGHTPDHMTGSAFVPVYRGVKGLASAQFAGIVRYALEQYGAQQPDILPFALCHKYRLISHAEALNFIHLPADAEQLRQARRRLAFEEFFIFQLQLQWLRRMRTDQQADVPPRQVPADAFAVYTNQLPATMTTAQAQACAEITTDFLAKAPMHRLLQGDVGSGKTWVAFWAAYAMWRVGNQTALMVPTEILAEQHFQEAKRILAPLGVQTALLTGSTAEKERRVTLDQLAQGKVSLLIGTHALLTESVSFADLGLVITDEQHRFGVSQRSVLRAKGHAPDVLLLSATPIPRTLALAMYGDLDVSTLAELPAGRKVIVTKRYALQKDVEAIRLVRQQIAKGRQAYVVAPLVDESEVLPDISSATQLYERWRESFAGFSVGLVHGRMSGKEKDAVMRAFVQGQVQILVSTTVIEVGVNVPNATVMLIYHAERFGLAQLHQLRGRVGRGQEQSYCLLLSERPGRIADERLAALEETTDGFVIAERDLALRGPGEFLGVRQSGLPEFTVGDLHQDFRMMETAQAEAQQLLGNPDFWLMPQYTALRQALEHVPAKRYFQDS